MDKEELFAMAQAMDTEEYCMLESDTSRVVVVPDRYKTFGVEEDTNVERVKFKFPKIVGDNVDLTTLDLRINFQNASGGLDKYVVDDVTETDDGYITFSWVIQDGVTPQSGQISFVVQAVKATEDGTIEKKWSTTLNKVGQILEGLEVDETIAQQNPDIIESILTRLDELEENGGGTVDPEQIKQAVNGYLEENPVSGMTAEQEQQLNQNISDVSDLKSALEQKGLPAGGTLGQVLVKKSDENYDAEWKNVSAGTSDQYFEMVSSGSSTTNGVSLDISGILSNPPTSGEWDDLQNWYRMSYRGDSIPALNGLPTDKIISRPIQGIPYFRAFTDQSNQYSLNNAVAFYGSDSDKAITEEGHEVKGCSKTYVYIPVDNLPDDTQGAGVIIVYPTESYDYYYIKINNEFFANNNTGKYNRTNPTYIAAFDSGVLENPLMSIAEYNEQYLKMKDEYLDGYYKNMFAYEPFVTIFKNYFAQMAPKVGIPQTFGKAIYIGGDSLHAYAGGDGKSTDGFVTNWNQYLGFSVVTNAGYAGSTWSELTGGGGLKRAKDLISAGTVYDVIILAWGTNDDTGGNGTIDDVASDAEGATMVAAMKWIITNLRNTFKSTAIGVIIPPPKGTEDGMKTRGDLMIQVCELLHVPYVDMREYISISDLGSDTVHLGKGAGKYGAAEASLILRICQYGDTLYPGTTD